MITKIKYAIACAAMLSMCLANVSCDDPDDPVNPNNPVNPDNPEPNPSGPTDPVGHKYSDTKSVPSEGGTMDITLSQLNAEVTNISTSAEWVSASKSNYTSGAPSIHITVQPNKGTTERSCTMLITSANKDELTLTIEQEAPPAIDDMHNETSGTPAYSRKH